VPPSIGSVNVVVHNGGVSDVWLLRDYEAPLWLEVDGGILLNGYGQSWCGQPDEPDNDPVWFFDKVAAGDSVTRTWDGQQVTFDSGGCWKKAPVAIGKHAARACVYDSITSVKERVGARFPAGPAPYDLPSTWMDPSATRCVDFTIEVPATGSVTADVTL
jgi:hypothetical protein